MVLPINSSHTPVPFRYLEPWNLSTWIPAGLSKARYRTSKWSVLTPKNPQFQQFLWVCQAILVCLHSTRRCPRSQSNREGRGSVEVKMLWCHWSICCTISWMIKPRLVGVMPPSGWCWYADLSSRCFCEQDTTWTLSTTNWLDVLRLAMIRQDCCCIRWRIQDFASWGHVMLVGGA